MVSLFGEHPEDLGRVEREEDGMVLLPASVWHIDKIRHLVDKSCRWNFYYGNLPMLLGRSLAKTNEVAVHLNRGETMGTYRMAGEGPPAKSLCSCNVRRGAPQIPSSRPPELMSIHLVWTKASPWPT